MLPLVGLATTTAGAVGYSFEAKGLECNVDVLKMMAIFYMLLSAGFLAHHVFMNDSSYHIAVHYYLSIVAFLIGAYILKVIKKFPHEFSTDRFKEVIFCGALIWLLDKNLNLNDYIDLASITLTFFSLFISLLSAYMFYTVKRLRTFFLIDPGLISATSFVVCMIGLSTLCMCVLPLVIAAVIVVYNTAKTISAIRPLVGI